MTEQCGSNMHEHHHSGGSCHCGCGCGCGSKHNEDGKCNCAENFLELADIAWKELMIEKIKAKMIAKKGEHIEKLAEIIATANGEKWKHKIGSKVNINDFKDKLKEFMSSCE